MSKLTDIINAATPGPWEWHFLDSGQQVMEGGRGFSVISPDVCLDKEVGGWLNTVHCVKSNARFIATFDPEHVALMEAVVDAADICHKVDRCADRGFDNGCAGKDECRAVAKLRAYRKERGLDA